MAKVFLSLGSNVGEREIMLRNACEYISDIDQCFLELKSPIYETSPVGNIDQADFLNQVVLLETKLSAQELLDKLLFIEKALGRKRNLRFGPRTIDIDILLYDKLDLSTESLIIPHPRLHQRLFVLVPLQDIAPGLVHPVLNKTIMELKSAVIEEVGDNQLIKRI